MGKGYRAKVFKSGNSLALRLPKTLGWADGEEVTLVPHDDGGFSLWRQQDQKQAFLGLFGSMSADFMQQGRGDIDQEERDWDVDGGRPQVA